MRVLFSVSGYSIRIADEERMILEIDDGNYYDMNGNAVPAEDSFESDDYCDWEDDDSYDPDDPEEQYWLKRDGTTELLIPESISEVEDDIDDERIGLFGYVNYKGEFVIPPQYADARDFSCGLAVVNLSRTWYTRPDGRKSYENHFGYIDEHGKTVIPFMFSDASTFYKYGVASVSTWNDGFLIDTKGNRIPGTENIRFTVNYDYESRYLDFIDRSCDTSNPDEVILAGIYDMKERRVLLEPSIVGFYELSEDIIRIDEHIEGEFGDHDRRQHYINSKGEILYPWLYNKGFAEVELPNRYGVAVVSVTEFIEVPADTFDCYDINGKRYKRLMFYGIYSPKEKFIVPAEYDKITEITENTFACHKNGVYTIIRLDESDYK